MPDSTRNDLRYIKLRSPATKLLHYEATHRSTNCQPIATQRLGFNRKARAITYSRLVPPLQSCGHGTRLAAHGSSLPHLTRGGWLSAGCILDPDAWLGHGWLYPECLDGPWMAGSCWPGHLRAALAPTHPTSNLIWEAGPSLAES